MPNLDKGLEIGTNNKNWESESCNRTKMQITAEEEGFVNLGRLGTNWSIVTVSVGHFLLRKNLKGVHNFFSRTKSPFFCRLHAWPPKLLDIITQKLQMSRKKA